MPETVENKAGGALEINNLLIFMQPVIRNLPILRHPGDTAGYTKTPNDNKR